MQFHLNGFRPGDPSQADTPQARAAAQPLATDHRALPHQLDVLIVGCGSAGLTLATQLARCAGIHTAIIDQKPGPLRLGQADGVACRTLEMLDAFGFADKVLREACHITETTFWKPDPLQPAHIVRNARVQDVADDLSYMPHVILNQARVHDFFLEAMRQAPAGIVPYYGRRLLGLVRKESASDGYPVVAQFERTDASSLGERETVRARYVVGCDGARSTVRQAIGLSLKGDSANQAWGVMDVLVQTDFPDVRFKSLIQSAGEGSALLIPREGGYMVRIYVELDKLNPYERVAARNITLEQLIAAAQRIFRPYQFDVKEVAWWSVYEIGQRLCDHFDDLAGGDTDASLQPRIFIAGDACHTHSPKAGQGMNVSMQDGFNLGWKLAAVLQGRCVPKVLHSYSQERQAVAQQLIAFDREWAALLSAPDSPSEKVQRYFVTHGEYTAGTATCYARGLLVGDPQYQILATGLRLGTRLHSAPVVRVCDARQLPLADAFPADTRWRLLLWAPLGDAGTPDSPVGRLCQFLTDAPQSPLVRYRKPGDDIDALIDVRAVFQQSHTEITLSQLPALLWPRKGLLGLHDCEKVFSEGSLSAYSRRGIDRQRGCLIVVRPDQIIAQVLPLGETSALCGFFDQILLPPHSL